MPPSARQAVPALAFPRTFPPLCSLISCLGVLFRVLCDRTVTQEPGSHDSLVQTGVTLPGTLGPGCFRLNAGTSCSWSAAPTESWIGNQRGHRLRVDGYNGFRVYTVEGNPNCVPRTATITVAGLNFTVTQGAGSGYYGLPLPSAAHTAAGGSGTVGINAGTACPWTATKDADWISFTSATSGNSTSTVAYAVQPNPNCAPRTGRITVAGLSFTVTQAGGAGQYSLSVPGSSFPQAGGNGSVNVSATLGCSWGTVNPNDWVTVISGSGLENGTVTYSVSPNPNGAARSATLIIAGQSHPITQVGNDDFAQRIPLGTVSSVVVAGSNEGTSIEGGEPAHADTLFGSSVWYSWTAAANGLVTLTMRRSTFDTLLAVYTGNSLPSLLPIASNDDEGGTTTSAVSFNAVAGVTYQIAVDAYAGSAGTIILDLSVSDPAAAPVITTPSPLTGGTVGTVFGVALQAMGGGLPYSGFHGTASPTRGCTSCPTVPVRGL